jgi:hypothetical protein
VLPIAIEVLTVLATLVAVVLSGWAFRDDGERRQEPEWASGSAHNTQPPDTYRVRLH